MKIRKPWLRFPLTTLAFTLLGCTHIAPAPPPGPALAPNALHSPWDTVSVSVTTAPYNCGPLVPVAPDTSVGNLKTNRKLSDDAKASLYPESTTAVLDLDQRVVNAADNFRATGSGAAAACAIAQLDAAASNAAMAGYIADRSNWDHDNEALLSLSIAYLKVRASGAANPAEEAEITHWFDSLLRGERTFLEHAHCGPNGCMLHNYSGHEAAAAAAAVGIAANDFSLFHWAITEYKAGVGLIDDRGMLHYDLHNTSSLKRHVKSAGALVQIAEFAETNGVPLYAYDGGQIHHLVHTVALGLADPTVYEKAAMAPQVIPSTLEPWEIAWAAVYNRRFPDPVVTSLLHEAGPTPADLWGGQPWSPGAQ